MYFKAQLEGGGGGVEERAGALEKEWTVAHLWLSRGDVTSASDASVGAYSDIDSMSLMLGAATVGCWIPTILAGARFTIASNEQSD